MKASIPNGICEALRERREEGALRTLVKPGTGIDLCSNDYLGISRLLVPEAGSGATGSRLVSGNSAEHEALEAFLAEFHQAEAALVFSSGYEANVGLLGSIGSRGDTIIYDELVHASMRDGVRLSAARSFSFRHNDPCDLRKKIAHGRGEVFVAVESIYSMDGHDAPLRELVEVCRERGAFLIVDEAHATGLYGSRGEGLIQSLNLQPETFARIHTFGKALGYRGATVVGSKELREYLINFARSFIYSTACDSAMVRTIRRAYDIMRELNQERAELFDRVQFFKQLREHNPGLAFLISDSPIQGVIIPGNSSVLRAEEELKRHGYFARGIRSPTVPSGQERIRLCLHSFNSREEIAGAVGLLASHARQGGLSHVA
jgi:8-amino-7-oxononanoate synthase